MEYNQNYERWLSIKLEDADLTEELAAINGKQEEIFDRFYKDLEFGTAGLRGVIGAGTNRMNIYTVRRATQGLADYLLEKYETASVAIAYDSRVKSELFAKEAACVLAANGIHAHLYSELMPTPALSYAVRDLGCQAGIVVTASHNPGKYNGYKVYGEDGCQMTLDAAEAVLAKIGALDLFKDSRTIAFEDALANNGVSYIDEALIQRYLSCVEAQAVNSGIIARSGLKLVYTPLNGAGNRCVQTVLRHCGIQDITVVPEQEHPDGAFPTCAYPNPESREALAKGLALCDKIGADLLIATDPDADRVGIAVKHKGEAVLLTGNQVGALLLDYIAKSRIANGTMPQNPIAIKTIVTSKLVDVIGKHYGVQIIDVLTGFKFIGEQILLLEQKGEENRFILGFEESYGYLAGTYVRDKDAIVGSMLIVEMATYYKEKGLTLVDALNALYEQFGCFCESVMSFEFEGAEGMNKMAGMMQSLRENPPAEIAGSPVNVISDYEASTKTTAQGSKAILLPKSNVLEYLLGNGCTVIVRPSGTEPKIKLYLSLVGKNLDQINSLASEIGDSMKKVLGV